MSATNIEMLITRGTAIAAFVAYVVALCLRLARQRGSIPTSRPWSRVWWTAGSVIFLIHVLCAFHFIHHWSHADAYRATARQTTEETGFDSGSGLYLNYAFTLLWLCDALWWCLYRASYETRPRLVEWTVHGFMVFMWFNATVVFGHGLARWLGIAGFTALAGWWRWNHRRVLNTPPHSAHPATRLGAATWEICILGFLLVVLFMQWAVDGYRDYIRGRWWEYAVWLAILVAIALRILHHRRKRE